jgi:hypothetical protein
MVKNVISWESEWEYAHMLTDRLQTAEKEGKLQHLCIRPGGWACFRTEERTHDLLRGLSERCGGKVIEHEWVDGDDCGSSLWQDGRENRYTSFRETPDHDTLISSVTEKVETWELYLDFQEKLDACWENCLAQWQSLNKKQIQERCAVIAATIFCYGRLSMLSWHKSWIACLNCLPDPLTAARDAFLAKMESESEGGFQTAVWAILDRAYSNPLQC